jgi:hypothetical protein
VEGVRVERAPGRCAFCKDEVAKDERAACAGCMAVHHTACFREHGACASCGEREALVRDGVAPKLDRIEQAQPPPRTGHYGWQEEPKGGMGAGLAVFLFVVLPIGALLLLMAAALMR